jgi:hypothetical protein
LFLVANEFLPNIQKISCFAPTRFLTTVLRPDVARILCFWLAASSHQIGMLETFCSWWLMSFSQTSNILGASCHATFSLFPSFLASSFQAFISLQDFTSASRSDYFTFTRLYLLHSRLPRRLCFPQRRHQLHQSSFFFFVANTAKYFCINSR